MRSARPAPVDRLIVAVSMAAAVLLACLVIVPPASAEVSVFSPTADTYVSAAAKTSRFGAARILRVSARPHRRAYLRFAVTLPAGAMIRRAVLRLHPAHHSRSVPLRANVAGTVWSEGRLRYRRRPRVGARLARWRGGRSGAGYQAVSLQRERIRNTLNSIALSTTTRRLARFGSRESRHPPQLAITFSAPPAPAPAPVVHLPDCSDGVDDDGDGRVDLADPSCAGPADGSETYPVPTVVMAAGDIQPASSTAVPTAALLNANPYDALLPLGDNQYEGGTLAEYNAFYSRSWGAPADKRRTYPVPGNHESESGLAANYCTYFHTGSAVDPCRGGRPYYSFELGAWHVVALDSSSGTVDDAQIAWLQGDLAAHRTACTLAYWHHPRYSPGGANLLNNAWAVLMAGGVDVAVVAHDHNYQRYAPMNNAGAVDTSHGIRQFVVGTGGRSHETFVKPVTGREVMNVDTFGLLRLSLGRGNFSWRFLPEPGRSFQDSGNGTCHRPNPDTGSGGSTATFTDRRVNARASKPTRGRRH